MLTFLHEGLMRFLRNPLGEIVAAALFLLAALTGFLLGVASLLYLSHLTPKQSDDPMQARMQFLQQLQGTRRTATAFWLGLFIWGIAILPNLQSLVLGIPLAWFLMQPLWCALLMTYRYDLALPIALKSVFYLTTQTPAVALRLYALGLLAFSGLICFGFGIFLTLPIALYATLRVLDTAHPELTSAIQRAY